MVYLRIIELRAIWNYLKKKITLKDKMFMDNCTLSKVEEGNEHTWCCRKLSSMIQAVLDAMGAEPPLKSHHRFSGGLPKPCLIQLARILNLSVSRKTRGYQLAGQIWEIVKESA